MLRRRFLGWQLAALLGVCAAASAQGPAGKAGPNQNAALLYWQAYGQLSQLPQAERAVVDNYFYPEKFPAKTRQEVFEKTADVAKTIHRAVRMPGCDWDEDLSQGWSPTAPAMPRVQMCRGLARFLAGRAKQQFERGQSRAAVDDLLAGFTLARHTAADDTIVGMLVGINIEGIIESECLDHLNEMDPATLDALQAGLDRLPPRPTWKAILAKDKQINDEWLIPQFAATNDPEAWKATLRRMFDPPAGPQPDGKVSPKSPNVDSKTPPEKSPADALIERFGTREAFVQHLQEVQKLLDELAQSPSPDKPSPELRAKVDAMASSPFFPALRAAMTGYDRTAVQFQMLRAAIAVQRHGVEALKDYPDPSGDGPFEYRKREGGFQLVSQFKLINRRGEPLSIKVGPLAKGEARWNL